MSNVEFPSHSRHQSMAEHSKAIIHTVVRESGTWPNGIFMLKNEFDSSHSYRWAPAYPETPLKLEGLGLSDAEIARLHEIAQCVTHDETIPVLYVNPDCLTDREPKHSLVYVEGTGRSKIAELVGSARHN